MLSKSNVSLSGANRTLQLEKKKEKKIARRNVEKKSLQYLKYILDSRTDCEKISGEIMRVTRR